MTREECEAALESLRQWSHIARGQEFRIDDHVNRVNAEATLVSAYVTHLEAEVERLSAELYPTPLTKEEMSEFTGITDAVRGVKEASDD